MALSRRRAPGRSRLPAPSYWCCRVIRIMWRRRMPMALPRQRWISCDDVGIFHCLIDGGFYQSAGLGHRRDEAILAAQQFHFGAASLVASANAGRSAATASVGSRGRYRPGRGGSAARACSSPGPGCARAPATPRCVAVAALRPACPARLSGPRSRRAPPRDRPCLSTRFRISAIVPRNSSHVAAQLNGSTSAFAIRSADSR